MRSSSAAIKTRVTVHDRRREDGHGHERASGSLGVMADPPVASDSRKDTANDTRMPLFPLSLASLITGLVVSVGTRWGLFRHYWVVVKLLINVIASIVLLLYMQILGSLADVAAKGDVSGLRSPTAVVHAGGAVVLLLVATTLSVYKPRGLTRHGRRKQDEQPRVSGRGGRGLVPAT